MSSVKSFNRRSSRIAIPAIALLFSSIAVATCAAQDDFPTTVAASHPLAYYRLDAPAGKSQVGATTYKSVGAVASASPGAPVGANSSYAKLDGRTGYILTTQAGGIGTAASIMAWVNLASLPSAQNHIVYVAGESQSGNDLDLQFETDNHIRFFTSGGGNIDYAPPPATLANQWHMVVATLDTVSKARALYWDGKPVSADKGGGSPNKTAPFTIGESPVFTGRFLKGGIQEAALWNRALRPSEIAAIYASASATPAAASASPSTGAASSAFPTNAKVEVDDSKGHLQLKRPEQIAIMFLSAIEQLEGNCDLDGKHACAWDQILSRLKYDPRTDPNYTYTLSANGTAWEAHATAKRAGLTGFAFMSRNSPGATITTFNASGTAGFVDAPLMSRSIEGDTFAK